MAMATAAVAIRPWTAAMLSIPVAMATTLVATGLFEASITREVPASEIPELDEATSP